MENINIADFELYLNWAVSALKTQDPQVVDAFKHEASNCLDEQSLTNILIAALHCLADSDPDTFQWALHNYDPEFYAEIRQRTVVAAARQLIRQGFVPGQDFSGVPVYGLIVNPPAKTVLWENTSTFSASLLREVLCTLQPA
jgi:hypothetical protein